MTGEYTPARRRPARRARGGRAGTESGTSDWPREHTGPPEYGDPAEDASSRDRVSDAPAPQDQAALARQVCLRLLTLAPRTRAQLAGALKKRGVPDDIAEEVLGTFSDVGLIDDAAFARAWVESRHHGRGLSARALSAELRRRGVDDDEIRAAVDELGPDAEVETARLLVAKRLAATRGLPPEARTRRLAGVLARKGYPPGLAFRVIREALEADGVAEDPDGPDLDGLDAGGDDFLDEELPVELLACREASDDRGRRGGVDRRVSPPAKPVSFRDHRSAKSLLGTAVVATVRNSRLTKPSSGCSKRYQRLTSRQ
jgi:regulatory protein